MGMEEVELTFDGYQLEHFIKDLLCAPKHFSYTTMSSKLTINFKKVHKQKMQKRIHAWLDLRLKGE